MFEHIAAAANGWRAVKVGKDQLDTLLARDGMPSMKHLMKTIRILATAVMGFEDMLITIHRKATFQSLEGKEHCAVTFSLLVGSSVILSMRFL